MERDMQELLNWDPNPDYVEEEETEEEEIIESDDIPADNITSNDVRDPEQYLLYLIIDKSGSMYNNGLEEEVRDSLERLKYVVNSSVEQDYMMNAVTFFGSTVEMHEFIYGGDFDTSYVAREKGSCLYDAIVKSANNMIHQYETMAMDNLVKGAMLIITDGAENGSQEYTEEDVKDAFKRLEAKKFPVILATFDNVNLYKFANKFGYVRLVNFENGYDIMCNFNLKIKFIWRQKQ